MKKLFSFICLTLAAVMLSATSFGCGGKKAWKTVGIVQLEEHVALDAANKGFTDELTSLAAKDGKTIEFINKNASGDKNTCKTIADTFVAKRVDLMLAIATPAAQAASGATDSIPILFTAVTDPVDAKLVDTIEVPKYNVSGTSDLNPIALQVELMAELVPNLKKIAVLYANNEKNSEAQVKLLEAKCLTLGIAVEKKAINEVADIESSFTSLTSGVQAIYLPTDNLLAKTAATVHSLNMSTGKKLPIVCGETGMNDKCGVATYGISYLELGKQTARMAYKILASGADISKMPVEYLAGEPELTINEKVAAELGFTIPQSVLDKLTKQG